jgi:hypothetical protein
MTTIRRSSSGASFIHNLSPPGQRVTFSIVAARELTRDECFAEVAKFLRTNAKPRRGSRIQLRAITAPECISSSFAR